MDGQPTLAENWAIGEPVDPRVYRVAEIAWGHSAIDLRWEDGSGSVVSVADGAIVPDAALNEARVVGVADRATDLIALWRELYRICAHGARVTVSGPYWTCVDAQADPTRRRGLSEQMFAYLSAPTRAGLRGEPPEDLHALPLLEGIDLDPVQFQRITAPEWEARSNEAKAWAFEHNVNVCRRLDALLVVHKPARETPR